MLELVERGKESESRISKLFNVRSVITGHNLNIFSSCLTPPSARDNCLLMSSNLSSPHHMASDNHMLKTPQYVQNGEISARSLKYIWCGSGLILDIKLHNLDCDIRRTL